MKNGGHADLPRQLAVIATEANRVPPTGSPVHALAGRSILPLLSGKADRIRGDDDSYGMEMFGRKALVKGDWKIIWVERPFGTGEWELFNIAKDRGEQNNLAASNAGKLGEMMEDWARYAAKNNVILPGKVVPALER